MLEGVYIHGAERKPRAERGATVMAAKWKIAFEVRRRLPKGQVTKTARSPANSGSTVLGGRGQSPFPEPRCWLGCRDPSEETSLTEK